MNMKFDAVCFTCGHAWPLGTDGSHSCTVVLSDRLRIARTERDGLRAALVAFVAVDGREDLEKMDALIRTLRMPEADRIQTLNAIHALIATLPPPAPASSPVSL